MNDKPMPALRNFSAGLIVLAEVGPDRMTVTQGAFFLIAGLADQAGRPATFSEIRETLGDVLNKSLHTTYKVFLEEGRNREGKREPGLGWLSRETDAADNRRKYLRLTNRGRQIMAEVASALAAAH
ncbi:hypothetical protein [Novosphingobium sp.]|uniref:hypothetical protein n=1 Tax=Novosphingobium sp. TaxID=1874826 RepID=UPI0025FE672F|nr:hypothetical protein [Novosphingobium sp.]